MGLALLGLGIAATLTARWLAPDNTYRVIRSLQAGGSTIAVLLAWWLLFSGARPVWRIAAPLLAGVLLAALAAGSIREIYFDGDMQPRFRWRWEVRPADRTAQWLQQQASATRTPVNVADSFQITADDWPRYCGFDSARRIAEDAPTDPDWEAQPPRELWRHPVGEAWSSFAVVGSRVFTQEQRGPEECVVCYDADSGQELWQHADPARYETAMGGIGPRATPTVTDTAVYALGATGLLNALHPQTGEQLWETNICRDAGADVLEWGMSGSPLIHNDTVIVDAGGRNGKAVIAYDRASGQVVWASENHQAGYAAPRLEQIAGQLQLLIFHGDGLLALDPDSGRRLWEYPWTNVYKINVAQPLRSGDLVFISSGYDAGCILLDPTQLTSGQPRAVWERSNSLKLKFNEAVQVGDFVYGLDDGILACVDVRTGERRWKGGRYRFGQVLLWGQTLLVQAEAGYVALVAASPERFREITRFPALNDRTWNVPVVNRGRLLVRNANEAACFDLSTQPTAAAPPVSEAPAVPQSGPRG